MRVVVVVIGGGDCAVGRGVRVGFGVRTRGVVVVVVLRSGRCLGY